MQRKLIIGTRGSKLALMQARIAAGRIGRSQPDVRVEQRVISTTGDRNQQVSLTQAGGKGIFIRELENALLEKQIDIAVHSFKDITVQMESGLTLCGFFSPESVADVLVSTGGASLWDLPAGARIGTGSMRRRALLLRLRPDLQYVDIRGNIDTRINKMLRGEYDGIVLSEAGLIRLNLQKRVVQRFDPQTFFPAPGQGVIALQARQSDEYVCNLCRRAGDERQRTISRAELSLLEGVGFDCRTPFGVYTTLLDRTLSMEGFYVAPDTSTFTQRKAVGDTSEPESIGRRLSGMFLDGRSQ